MAGPDASLARLDAPVCPPVEAHPGLRPFLDVAGSPRAERWLDADHGAARPVYHRKAGAIPALLPALKAAGAGRSAARARRPGDVVPERHASAFLPENLDWPLVFAAVEPCKQAVGRSVA
jgi:hypothetical protein